jgi:hypothetical protein
LGQARSSNDVRVTSAFPPIATEQRKSSEVGSGPKSDVVISGPPSHLAELGNADRHEFLQVGEENDPFFADRIVERFARIERDFDAS